MLADVSRNIHDNVAPSVECEVSGRKRINAAVCIADEKVNVINIVSTPYPEIHLSYRAFKLDFVGLVILCRIDFKPVLTFAVELCFYTQYLCFIRISIQESERIRYSGKIPHFRKTVVLVNETACLDFPCPFMTVFVVEVINNKSLHTSCARLSYCRNAECNQKSKTHKDYYALFHSKLLHVCFRLNREHLVYLSA